MILSKKNGKTYYRCDFLAYFHAMHVRHGRVDTKFLEPIVDKAITEKNKGLLKTIVHELGQLTSERKFHRPVLEVIKFLLQCNIPEVEKDVVNLLARMRRFARDDVDDFMIINELSPETQTKVKTVEVEEEVAGDLLQGPLYRFVGQAVVRSPELRNVAIWAFEQTIHYHTMEQFLSVLIKQALNLTYGEDIFRLKRPLKSGKVAT